MKEQLIKFFCGELIQSERIELLHNIEKDKNLKKEYIFYRNTQAILSWINHPGDIDYGEKKYYRFIAKNKKNSFTRIVRYAAVAILLIIGSWSASVVYHKYAFNDITYNTLSVPAGQRASVVLSDGTKVWLNAKSSIKYPSNFSGKMRKVMLQGEAFFNVTSNKNEPFIVSTSSLDVKVLGTIFNVKENKSKKSIDVSLIEGAVEVLLSEKKSRIALKPLQNLCYSNGIINISDLLDENNFLWKEGILNFENLLLSDICKKLEEYYCIKIIINNPKIKDYYCTGKFRQQDGPYEILRIIQEMYYFKMEKYNDENLIILD